MGDERRVQGAAPHPGPLPVKNGEREMLAHRDVRNGSRAAGPDCLDVAAEPVVADIICGRGELEHEYKLLSAPTFLTVERHHQRRVQGHASAAGV